MLFVSIFLKGLLPNHSAETGNMSICKQLIPS
ncbi:hypothetical protein BN1723_018047 [Verticillium longisporum]|uniref:Uncharacterized protein n=1 Tax=Verticillium longisporum TaxID=100787 RepID=A0A0G4LM41_VERLO|nr:hypothetical protein BN1723_018047 [Verticillium longisporum]